MTYKIISTGSKGNAVLLNGSILIDCGVPFAALDEIYKSLKLVLLTHIHSDHFNRATISRLSRERPTLRFGCMEYLYGDVLKYVDNSNRIDVYSDEYFADYGDFGICPVSVTHDVPNCGYRIVFENYERLFYVTDAANLNGVQAKDYDYYFIEANYDDDEIQERILQKELSGKYAYEKRVLDTHLSLKQAEDFICRNMKPTSRYLFLHGHLD